MADIVEVIEVGAQVVEVVQVGPPGPAGSNDWNQLENRPEIPDSPEDIGAARATTTVYVTASGQESSPTQVMLDATDLPAEVRVARQAPLDSAYCQITLPDGGTVGDEVHITAATPGVFVSVASTGATTDFSSLLPESDAKTFVWTGSRWIERPLGATQSTGTENDLAQLAALIATKADANHTHSPAEIKSVYLLTLETTPAEFYAAPNASVWIVGSSSIDIFGVLTDGVPLQGNRRVVNCGSIPIRIATTSFPQRTSTVIPVGATAEVTYAGGTSVTAVVSLINHNSIAFTGSSTIPTATSTNSGLMSAASLNKISSLETAMASKADIAHTHQISDVGGLAAALATVGTGSWGPLVINRFRSLYFASSSYAPNGQNPAGMYSLGQPSGNVAEGWGMDGSWPRIFNPAKMLGAGATYRISAYVRVSDSFNDGVHCQIRVFDGVTVNIVPGLGDFGGGSSPDPNRIFFATSDSLTAADQWMAFALYCGAYGSNNNSNGAVIQDTVLTFYRQ
jgi:hypothetical protein